MVNGRDEERWQRGLDVLAGVEPDAARRVVEALADVSPALAEQIVGWAYGEIYTRPGLTSQQRELVTLGVLVALGGCEEQIRMHVSAALTVGLSQEQIAEALLHTTVYCGVPRALNATLAAKDVFAQRGLLDGEG
ncbi:carboxymuconolactone decarboxylase family protein [Streptomyces sp. NPDC050085]|uniref:carboxymuconolactone decarboxylase family protein n=1 Tax=Streptomyces sp. NPDC050085 TaxID=3365600 RepID=UPI00379C196B